MVSYAMHISSKSTSQSKPVFGRESEMVSNNAGGFTFNIDDWKQLDRFLILGSEGGSYYVGERELTIENAKCVQRCLNIDGKRTVDRIVEISVAGRAPKNDSAIFALAICASFGNVDTKKYALQEMPKVCRIGTHLFQFVESVKQLRGFGRQLCKGIANWYLSKDVDSLAYQCIKYQQRNGMSHRDVLRLCHANNNSSLFRWIIGANLSDRTIVRKTKCAEYHSEYPATGSLPDIVNAFEEIKSTDSLNRVKELILDYSLPRECIPTKFLTESSVWEALLESMPMTAMIRNLATMTRVGLIAPLSNATVKIVNELTNIKRIRKSRVHPITILSALKTYSSGHGLRGQNSWEPVSQIVDALDSAFYNAFTNVVPTNKRWLLGIDVSGSMDSGMVGGILGLTPRVAAAAMALVTANTEPNHHIMGFSHKLVPLSISPRQRLDDVCRYMKNVSMGGTDCAAPMIYAMTNKIPVDIFVVYTDSETWWGGMHPYQALQQYRSKMGRSSQLVVVGMVSNKFSIADPNDAGMLDVVGFDSSVPEIISNFVAEFE